MPAAESGPEHVVLGRDGKLFAAVASGRILRMNPDCSAPRSKPRLAGACSASTSTPRRRRIAADAVRGLLAVDSDRRASVLSNQVNGDPVRYADAAAVARNGKIYVSDASGRLAPAAWGGTFEAAVLDIIERRATGRIVEYDPATQEARVVVRSASFPNGVALSADEEHLYGAETGRDRIWKLAVDTADLHAGSRSAQTTVLSDNLPGHPDHRMRGREGRVWVGLNGPRGAAVDDMAGTSFLRALTLRLPRALWSLPKPYGHVFAFDDRERIVADLQDPAGSHPETTGVTETADRLYIQNLHLGALGWKAR